MRDDAKKNLNAIRRRPASHSDGDLLGRSVHSFMFDDAAKVHSQTDRLRGHTVLHT